jgi:excinuclease ABC subunit C
MKGAGDSYPLVISETRGYILPGETSRLPDSPGVYIMKNAEGTIIYIGKAISLKKRVSSYFRESDAGKSPKTLALVAQVSIIDYISVGSESEALLLEANLIKLHNPRYNVVFKDNKFYPSIKLTVREEFPRIVFTRDRKKDGSKYFGPYISAYAVRSYIDLVERLFKLRTCHEMPRRECLNYHIHRCSGPCIGKVSKDEYAEQVRQAQKFLGGDAETLIVELERKMQFLSKELRFEQAKLLRDRIQALRVFEETQTVFLQERIDADFVNCATHMGRTVFVVISVRAGKMVGKRSYSASSPVEEEDADMLAAFVMEYVRQEGASAPRIVIPPEHDSLAETLQAAIRETGSGAEVGVPKNDRQRTLSRMAAENAALHLAQVVSKVDAGEALRELQEILELETLPMRIEGFDIAHLLGENAVASLVSFYGGKPDKKNYRHLKIKGENTPDDTSRIHEAVYRRYKRLHEENADLPDLVLIDGGRGQLNAALEALAEAGIQLPVVALAKQNEEIYTPYLPKPIVLPRNSEALHVLQQVRDETHRFANTAYGNAKSRSMLASVLDGIPGIGEKRKALVVEHFLDAGIRGELEPAELEHFGIPADAAEEAVKRLRKLSGEK